MNLWNEISEAITAWLIASIFVGTGTSLLLAGVLHSIPVKHSRYRYPAAVCALFLLPVLTTLAAKEFARVNPAPISSTISTDSDPDGTNKPPGSADSSPGILTPHFSRWIALFWLCGVCISFLRTARNLRHLSSLRRNSHSVKNQTWLKALSMTQSAFNSRSPVLLLASHGVSTPVTFGIFQPAIVIPMSCLTGMPPQHIQPVLSHELAHIIRRDFPMSLVIRIVESLFFYHPAVWWISREIRNEREHACDDITLDHETTLLRYSKALLWLEENRERSCAPALALAANRTPVASRVERLSHIQSGHPERIRGTIFPALPFLILLLFFPSSHADSVNSRHNAVSTAAELKRIETTISRTRLAATALSGEFSWKEPVRNGRKIPLLRSILIIKKDGNLVHPQDENTPIFSEFPNSWILEHGLNFLDANLPVRDSDGDGFTNMEEFEKETSPSDPRSHPLRIYNAQFGGRKIEQFPILFSAQLDEKTVQLHTVEPVSNRKKSGIYTIGDITHNKQFQLKFIDINSVTVTFLPNGRAIKLTKKKWAKGELQYAKLVLPFPEANSLFVEKGSYFRIPGEKNAKYRLSEVEESSCLIELPDRGVVKLLLPK